ncbi:MAG: hypothetical protein HOV81_30255 [Kofleriaceae bacterium]|nr:hypothetical protein [Kofleriaceae bacterium]
MNGRVVTALLVSLVACKGSESKCPEPKPAPAPAPAPKEVGDTDPDFIHVDRDQLASLCLSRRLPPVSYPSSYGALSLADGKRVPWLTVWVEEDKPIFEENGEVPALSAKEWLARANGSIKWGMAHWDGKPEDSKRSPHEWWNFPCDASEVFSVVTTGVVFEKKRFHAFAMRGGKVVQEELSASTPREAVFQKAFELTEKLVGQSATIATHKLGGRGEAQKTIDHDVWVAAAK